MGALSVAQVRRLALVRAGLLRPELSGLAERAAGTGRRARRCAHAVIERFGYLQLDTVSVAGARSHGIVLASRLEGFDTRLGEELLMPGEPLFEYWGHEASWLPLDLYPHFAFRRREFRVHPWWGDLLTEHRSVASDLLRRIEAEGPLRSLDLEGSSGQGWWDIKLTKRIAEALWSAGELAVSSRANFQRTFDLPERVVPASVREQSLGDADAIETLLLKALDGHGWASTGTLAATWRLVKKRAAIADALGRLVEKGLVVPCFLQSEGRRFPGWIRPTDLELVDALGALRPRRNRGVLLSPFDPLLWDRKRVKLLFDFDQVLEIYKPEHLRQHGYYCLPVLAGEHLVARVDLKADRSNCGLKVRACRFENRGSAGQPPPRDVEATHWALGRFARSVSLQLER